MEKGEFNAEALSTGAGYSGAEVHEVKIAGAFNYRSTSFALPGLP